MSKLLLIFFQANISHNILHLHVEMSMATLMRQTTLTARLPTALRTIRPPPAHTTIIASRRYATVGSKINVPAPPFGDLLGADSAAVETKVKYNGPISITKYEVYNSTPLEQPALNQIIDMIKTPPINLEQRLDWSIRGSKTDKLYDIDVHLGKALTPTQAEQTTLALCEAVRGVSHKLGFRAHVSFLTFTLPSIACSANEYC